MFFQSFMIHVASGKGYWFACFAAVLLFAGCQQADNKPVEKLQKYETGKISRRYEEINGVKEGKMTDYYPDGPLKAESVFKNGKQEGRALIYYSNGKIKEVQYYEKGLKQGGDTVWYEDGNPKFVLEFNQGKMNGYLRKWAPDNSLTFEAKYDMDSLVEVKGKRIHHDGRQEPVDTSHN